MQWQSQSVIKNKQALLSHGNVEGRRIALDIIEYAIKAVNSYELVRRIVFIRGQTLNVGRLK
ncbi:MAG: hypothetical protein LZ158_02180 [Thaumarchaeota archaeon]|nr:hypothetical protein [Candidatus Terraquivivens yellowstonensis]MCL7392706.1 hypothetical protein [Candidatus Terraquivivens yellowstonensis]MCL7398336.1 hypothetical protein [Candidatus Terraquivivens yellowstonensis]MCL7400784.1 hypothetical protein [Candidatus Terraquivivens yellowstonensis]